MLRIQNLWNKLVELFTKTSFSVIPLRNAKKIFGKLFKNSTVNCSSKSCLLMCLYKFLDFMFYCRCWCCNFNVVTARKSAVDVGVKVHDETDDVFLPSCPSPPVSKCLLTRLAIVFYAGVDFYCLHQLFDGILVADYLFGVQKCFFAYAQNENVYFPSAYAI